MNIGSLMSWLSGRLRFLSTPSGYVERFDIDRAVGWWTDPENPSDPVTLSLHVDGQFEMHILADRPRDDVFEAGRAQPRCGFDVPMPKRLHDGQAHLVVLRRGTNGRVLRGGKLRIAAARGDTEESMTSGQAVAPTGLAFVDKDQLAVVGWATGCTDVQVRFDNGPAITVPIDRIVPGFGDTVCDGFRLPVPATVRDGGWHDAAVTFGTTGAALDGSPLRFWAAPARLEVQLVVITGGQEVEARLCNGAVAAPAIPVTVMVDDALWKSTVSDSTGMIRFGLPAGAREVTILDDTSTPPEVIGRYTAEKAALRSEPGQPLHLAEDLLNAAACAQARDAFDAFCAAPDTRLDKLWYAQMANIAPAEAATHYANIGAPAGHSPSPRFDERAVRGLYPQIAQAIKDERLPAAFALELVLGAGALQSLRATDLAALPAQAGRIDMGVAPDLPAPTAHRAASENIYAAWMARLDVPDDTRASFAVDEAQVRDTIQATRMIHCPLVSIIMPTYNRAYTIGEAIQSALDQSYENWELLVCDDASDDKTAEVVRGFDDPRIRYMQFAKSNGAETRNKGLSFARGAYIAYLDSDNLWNPHFLDLMLRQLMGAPGSAIAYCGYVDTEISGARVLFHKISQPVFRPIQLSGRNFMDLNTIVHHRRLYDWMGGFDKTLPRLQDWDLMLRYTSVFRPVFTPHCMVFYRRNVAWGQVTHLFQNSGAQHTVNEKTARRLSDGHERLQIDWPTEGAVTVLAGPGFSGSGVVADTLANLAALVASVDLVDLTGRTVPADTVWPDGVTHHVVPDILHDDPYRMGHILAALLHDRPVLCLGMATEVLRALPGLCLNRLLCLEMTAQGIILRSLHDHNIQFHLGAVPLVVPESVVSGIRRTGSRNTVLLVPQDTSEAALETCVALAGQHRLNLLLPPGAGGVAAWQQVQDGTLSETSTDPATGLPVQLDHCTIAASLRPVAALDPYLFSLLNALQGRGTPLAVIPGKAPDDLVKQWVEARGAYEIKTPTPQWVLEKLLKIMADAPTYDRLSTQGIKAHQIALHDELSRERLAYALYRLLFERPQQELYDV